MTKEEKLSRDISAIRKSLQSIAEDLRYFRKKDEAEAATEEKEEEPDYTCRDCTMYQRVVMAEPNDLAHWCVLYCCTISDEGLNEICDNFERKENPNATE